jgi:molybdopterin/thiamine biosynthesis adenylyltransferase
MEARGGKTLGVGGAGGTIGSQLVGHLGRMAAVAGITLVDRDTYERRNVGGQDITLDDVGRPKVAVQARRLAAIDPSLPVVAIHDALENVALGRLRADVVLGCLDSRAARRTLGEAAWRLGAPYVDAGIEPTGMLARVNVYLPGPDAPCIECAWGDDDWAALAEAHPCDGGVAAPAPTNAPSSLGALAAALQAIECRKLLAGDVDRAAVGREVLIDATWHRHWVTTLRRNPACRFDHAVWRIERLADGPEALTVGDALALDGAARSGTLRVAGARFVTRLACAGCGTTTGCLRVASRTGFGTAPCPACGAEVAVRGFDLTDRVEAAGLAGDVLGLPLARVGVRAGDVLSVGSPGDEAHYEIGGAECA